MSLNPTDPEMMAHDYFERELSEEENDALFEALNESPELRDSFMETARDEWLLNHALHLHQATVQPSIRIHQPLRRRVRRIAALIAILLSLVSVFVAHRVQVNIAATTAALQSAPLAKVVDLYVMENDVITVVNQGELRELTLGDQLRDGDRVVVPRGARLTYQYLKETTAVAVSGNTLLSVSDREGSKIIRLNRGHLKAVVDKQDPNAPMRVVTDDAVAVVVGTTFEITASEFTELAVHEGCVRLKSFLHNKSVDVSGGELVSSLDMNEQAHVEFAQIELKPLMGKSVKDPAVLSKKVSTVAGWLLGVDAERGYTTFLRFDLGDMSGRIIEAKLQLTVAQKHQDPGGEGIFRLHRLSPSAQPEQLTSFGPRHQVGYFQGAVDKDLQLEIELDPEQLIDGINNFELSQDKGGNDCWFTSVGGGASPKLILKIRNEDK